MDKSSHLIDNADNSVPLNISLNENIFGAAMTEVLVDLYSIFSLNNCAHSIANSKNPAIYKNCFPIIENLIICEKVILDKHGVMHHDLLDICLDLSQAIRLISDERLYSNRTTESNTGPSSEISERVKNYLDAARDNELYYSPHPIRGRILKDKITPSFESTGKYAIKRIDKAIMSSLDHEFNDVSAKIPPLVEHVLCYSEKNNISLLSSIIDIRESKNATIFRSYFGKLDDEIKTLSPRKKVNSLQKLTTEIERLEKKWTRDIDLDVNYKERTINLSKIPVIGHLFEILGIKDLDIKDPILHQEKSQFLLINDIYKK